SDLRNFHKRYIFPANVMLGIWGDFETAQMKAMVENLFADWTVTQPAVPDFPKFTATPAAGVCLAEKKDAPQTWFAMGHAGGIANQKDYAALEVMGLVFDQLQERIRQRARTAVGTSDVSLMGLALDKVSAAWGAGFVHPGVFQISVGTRGPSTLDAIR